MHVSCRATRMLVEAVDAVGLDPTILIANTTLTLDHLRDTRARLTWNDFTTVLDNLERGVPDPEALERVGLALVRTHNVQRRVGAWLLTPKQALWLFVRGIAPGLFPVVRADLSEDADGKLSLALEIPPDARGSSTFFRICKGAISGMPRAFGLSDARVEADISSRRAVYVITQADRAPIWRRLRRALDADGAGEQVEIERYRQELHESYDALLRSRQNFRALLEKMSDSVCVHRDGRVVWGNHAFLEQLGRGRVEDIVGLSILEDILHPDDRAELARTMRLNDLPSDQPSRRFRVLRPDGTTILIEISAPQLVEFDGEPARLVVGRDITERRRQESAMVVADRMASIGVLAAGVAHEINNPLAYVHANLVVAEQEIARVAKAPALSEAIAAARDGTERVRRIVRDLKTLARGDEEHLEAVDLRAVVESALTLARRSIEQRAHLTLALGEVPAVRGNRARLGQVVLNLLLNAAEAIPDGRREAHEIAVSTAVAPDDYVVLTVRDTGSGIEPGDLRRIFDPFFTTKGQGQGTGLGLSICHRIVTSLGGRMEVESTPGAGTTFRMLLPATAMEVTSPSPSASPVRPAKPEVRRARVLVVDDEPQLLSVLALVLSERHEVVTLPDARAALEMLRGDDSFDVVICDLMMARMTGMELHEALRIERPGMERRMVFMTGGTFTAHASAFLAATPQRWLEKPFDMDRLLDAVRDQLNPHSA